MSKLSNNIRHLRALKKWSQEQLAEQLEIPRARIGSYEEERCDPPIETVIKLSNLFHIAIDALVKCDLSKFDSESFMKVGENRILFHIIVESFCRLSRRLFRSRVYREIAADEFAIQDSGHASRLPDYGRFNASIEKWMLCGWKIYRINQ